MKKKIIFGVMALVILAAVALAGCTPQVTVNVPATPVTITTPAAAATTSPSSLMGGTVEQMIQLQMYKSILGDTTSTQNQGGWGGGHGGHGGGGHGGGGHHGD